MVKLKKDLAVLALAVACVATSMTDASAADKLQFGFLGALTGPQAGIVGMPGVNAAEMIIDASNQGTLPTPYGGKKGFGGLEAKLVPIDEAMTPAEVATEVRDVIERSHIDALVGSMNSGTCLAFLPVVEELKTLTVLSTCGTPRVFEDADLKYVFRTSSNATADGITAARYLTRRMPDLKSFGGLNPNYAFGQDSWRDFSLAMKAFRPDLKPTTNYTPDYQAFQYSAEISSLLTEKPQAVFSSFFASEIEAFVSQMTPRKLQDVTKLIFSTGETVIYKMGDRLPDGIIIGGRGPYGVFAHQTELAKWFRDNYVARYKAQPVYTAYHAAQAILALKIAYDKAAAAAPGQTPNTESVMAALKGIEYEAFGTTVSLSRSAGHQAADEGAMGTYKFDKATGTATVVDVEYYPADCINPPEGTKAVDWLTAGMPGAKCN